MPVRKITDATLAELAGPTCRGLDALLRVTLQEDVNLVQVRDGRVLLISDFERRHTPSDRVVGIVDRDAEPFQRTVSIVRASEEFQIRSSQGIKARTVVKTDKSAAMLYEADEGLFLFRGHPYTVLVNSFRPVHTVTQDAENLDWFEVLCRKGANVEGEAYRYTGLRKRTGQILFDLRRVVNTIADKGQSTRTFILFIKRVVPVGAYGYRELIVQMLDVGYLGDVIREPIRKGRRDGLPRVHREPIHNDVTRLGLRNEIADTPTQFDQEGFLPLKNLGATDVAKCGDDGLGG
jgi:hypothetical protein